MDAEAKGLLDKVRGALNIVRQGWLVDQQRPTLRTDGRAGFMTLRFSSELIYDFVDSYAVQHAGALVLKS